MTHIRRHYGTALVLLSVFGFGSIALFAKLVYATGVSPSVLLALRFALASVMLGLVVAVRRARLPRGLALLGVVLMGLLYIGQSQAYFSALAACLPS